MCHLFSTFIPVSGALFAGVCSRNSVSPVLHFYSYFRSPVCRCVCSRNSVSHVLRFYSCFMFQELFASVSAVKTVCHLFSTFIPISGALFASVSAVETVCHMFSAFTPVSLFQELFASVSAVKTVCHLFSTFIPISGALFASVSAVETVCHLVSTTVYNQVYMATLDIFPGAIFLLMTAFLFVDFVLLM